MVNALSTDATNNAVQRWQLVVGVVGGMPWHVFIKVWFGCSEDSVSVLQKRDITFQMH